MIQVHPDLYVGSIEDFKFIHPRIKDDWRVVHAAKYPYHRDFVGYNTVAAPKDSPEYLYALRGFRLALNMVDSEKPEYFSKELIDRALDFIDEGLKNGRKVLVHCNEGVSRAPSIALLYLGRVLKVWDESTLEEAADEFMQIYPSYNPGKGIWGHMWENWYDYGL
jgi:predicted protein tyrosine phosphatase